MMDAATRLRRHLRIMHGERDDPPRPSFLVLFINSICNMKCEHCFYWTSLNKKDDLSVEELFALSRSMGRIENLNLSGGEPFLRSEFAEICRQFIRHNGVRQIYVPTNGFFTDRTAAQVTATLEEKNLDLLVVELSLDGMPEFHDRFRAAKNAFSKAMETYEALARIQESDPRLRIHCISTATNVNMEEIRRLTTYLYDRCPKMDHHNLAVIRGDRKNPSLTGPVLRQYEDLYEYIRRLWALREQGRYGSIVEPMLQWAKVKTIKEEKQVVPCLAGRISAVVYANGDVGLCEIHKPIGNLRQKTFPEIWSSAEARELRRSIAARECYCTTEVFLWPSVVYQPVQLVRGMIAGNILSRPVPLPHSERADYGGDILPPIEARIAAAGPAKGSAAPQPGQDQAKREPRSSGQRFSEGNAP
jgi:MoaA/NifB/PqqE/SkfB family radical SAM enzyme